MGYRNGLNGKVLKEMPSAVAVEPRYRAQRVRRTRLQAALIAKVPEGVIKLRKRLVSLNDLGAGGARLVFEDGEEVVADLVVGGDGIRSVRVFVSFANIMVLRSKANSFILDSSTKCLSRPCYSIYW
jgi:hypothetical protein